MSSEFAVVHPVILSGGAGTRLWPLSRAHYPKQLLPLHSDHSLIQETAQRMDAPGFTAPLVICNEEHRFIIGEQLQAVGVTPAAIVLEPEGRNTAPAAALAALALMEQDAEALVLLTPSDHVITDAPAFREAVQRAVPAAQAGALVTFGITPDRPATGYGYIQADAPLPDHPDVHRVTRFVEKPDRATAEGYLAEGNYYWNAGIFLFSAQALLSELETHAPAVVTACRAALDRRGRDVDFVRVDRESFATAPNISLDYAVMEHTRHAAVVPVDMGWSDVGAWPALWALKPQDDAGNVIQGDVVALNTRNSYVHSEGPLTAVVGLDNVVVVASDDAVLVTSREAGEDVKAVVDHLKASGRHEHVVHRTVHRPWGSYRQVDAGDRYQVKRITVQPGARLSSQMHHHRAEHWVVVRGTARVTCDDHSFLVRENESTFVPLGTVHRLENPGVIPLELIEVQSGPYLGEDDIVRFDDVYGRAPRDDDSSPEDGKL